MVQLHENGSETWDSGTLANHVWRLAHGLRDAGIGHGVVVLWAPNSPVWVVSALAVLAAGGMLVPIDDLAEAAEFEAGLKSSSAPVAITARRHHETASAVFEAQSTGSILIDRNAPSPAASSRGALC